MRNNPLHLTLAAMSCFAASWPGLAQQTQEVVVEATPRVEATKVNGAPAVSIVHRVDYADLNIGTHSGAIELEKRIKDNATQACAQLQKLYPTLKEPYPSCVQVAVKNAMAQANKAIAAAEKPKE